MKEQDVNSAFWLNMALYLLAAFLTPVTLIFSLIALALFCVLLRDKTTLSEPVTTWLLGFLVSLLVSNVYGDADFVYLVNYFIPYKLQVYFASISVAHMGEYLFVLSFHPSTLNWDSFLLN